MNPINIDQTNYINKINKIDDIVEINKTQLKNKALILIDFDDTIAKTGHSIAAQLGGIKWRDILRKTIEELQKAREISQHNLLFECLTLFIAKSVPVAAVQPEMASIIKGFENEGHQVLVFTARGRSGKNAWYKLTINGIDALTEQQMQNAGIHLTSQPLPLHEKIYHNSMIFAQNTAKDELLKELFDKNIFKKEEFSHLIYIDDKADAITKLQTFAAAQGLSFVGWHYTAVETTESNEYHLLKATIQMVNLFATGKFLSKQEMDAKALEFQSVNSMSPQDYFKQEIKKLDQVFTENHLYNPFENTDLFFNKISEVVKKTGIISH